MIYGISARDLTQRSNEFQFADLSTPWLDYASGEPSPEGWLIAHSMLVRYDQTYRFWVWDDFLSRMARTKKYRDGLSPYGFFNYPEAGDISGPPDLEEFSLIYRELAGGFQPSAQSMTSLYDLAALQNTDETIIILVEMPLPPTFWAFFPNGEADYALFIDAVASFSEETGIEFIRSIPELVIPEDGWSDYSHLNLTGSQVFSLWLGEKLRVYRMNSE